MVLVFYQKLTYCLSKWWQTLTNQFGVKLYQFSYFSETFDRTKKLLSKDESSFMFFPKEETLDYNKNFHKFPIIFRVYSNSMSRCEHSTGNKAECFEKKTSKISAFQLISQTRFTRIPSTWLSYFFWSSWFRKVFKRTPWIRKKWSKAYNVFNETYEELVLGKGA